MLLTNNKSISSFGSNVLLQNNPFCAILVDGNRGNFNIRKHFELCIIGPFKVYSILSSVRAIKVKRIKESMCVQLF